MHITVSTLSGMKMNNNLWHHILIDNDQTGTSQEVGYKPVEMKQFHKDCKGITSKDF